MASADHGLGHFNPEDLPDASELKFGVVVSDYNDFVTHRLLESCIDTLESKNAAHIKTLHVPGSFELVGGAMHLLEQGGYHAVICLGCVIKGETEHDTYINHAVAQGITNLTIQYKTPVLFGLLTTNTRQQAEDRAGGKHGNKGAEAAQAAIFMGAMRKA